MNRSQWRTLFLIARDEILSYPKEKISKTMDTAMQVQEYLNKDTTIHVACNNCHSREAHKFAYIQKTTGEKVFYCRNCHGSIYENGELLKIINEIPENLKRARQEQEILNKDKTIDIACNKCHSKGPHKFALIVKTTGEEVFYCRNCGEFIRT
jgi:late competence protein required for DNA uptake (superfamily II DNA/RNA helicase)